MDRTTCHPGTKSYEPAKGWLLWVLLVLFVGHSVAWCDESEPAFTYRWMGTDQWAAEHGCNVNIPKEYQKKGEEYYRIWGSYHTLGRLLPPDEYFKSHPEYFALRGPLRTPEQLCLSHPEVQQIVAEALIGIIRDNPDLTAVTLGPQDNRLFCECDRCRALDEEDPAPDQLYSRSLFLFYRAVADRVHRVFPDIFVRFGCYDVYAAPPKDRTLTLPPHTFPLICHYQKYCNSHPISDPTCAYNTRFREIIADWRQRSDQLFMYEYYYKVNWLGMPWPLVHSIRDDIPWYRDNGVKGFYSQYNPNAAGCLLNYDVAAALMLDPKADVDRLVEGFCRESFGPAWQEMRAYYETLEKAMQDCGVCIPGRGFAFPHGPKVFTEDVLRKCSGLVEAATDKVTGTSYEGNVRKFALLMDYAERCVAFLRLAVQGLGEGRLGVPEDRKEEIGKRNEEIGKRKEKREKGGAERGKRKEEREERREKALEALGAGKALERYVRENKERFEGVIPYVGRVNPYMQVILNALEKVSRGRGNWNEERE